MRRGASPFLAAHLLGAALLLAAALSADARAGPAEARARWKEAQAAKAEAWPVRVRLLRAARSEAGPADPIVARAAAAESKVLRAAGRMEGAAAAEALAAGFGAPRDPDRLAVVLSAAREALSDSDVTAAEVLLKDVLEHGGAASPATTGPALVLLARLAGERRDLAEIDRLSRLAGDEVPRLYDDRLAVLDLLGLLRLSAGDEPAARRALAEERRLYDEAKRQGDVTERLASKAWLSLELPKRLEGG